MLLASNSPTAAAVTGVRARLIRPESPGASLPVCRPVGVVHSTVTASPPSAACYSGLMSTNESSLPPPPPRHPSLFLPSQSNGRLQASLLVATAGTRGLSAQTRAETEPGRGGGGGPNHREMRFQQTSASAGPVWMANYCWLMLYYFTTKDCCREKGASGGGGGGGGEGCEAGRREEGPGNPGRVPEGKKGLVNAIIIFKNITGATATSAKNRLGRAKLLHPL